MKNFILCLIGLLTLFSKISAQNKWQPFAGLHLSLNSDAYYVGPSFSAGVQHFLDKPKKWSFTPSIHYFKQEKRTDINSSTFETAKFLSYSIRSNFNYHAGKTGKFIAGGGLGFQFASDDVILT